MSTASDPVLFCARNNNGSFTSIVVELTVVVVPETTRSPLIVNAPAELKDITSDAAPDAPNIKLIFDALLSAAKSPSDTTLIEPAVVIASVPVPSSGATKSIAPITSFTAISVSPAARVRVGNLSSPDALCFRVRPLSAS